MTKRKRIGRAVTLVLLAVILAVHLVTRFSEGAADFVNGTVAFAFRFTMAKISDLFPFALSEFVIALIPTALLVVILVGIVLGKTAEGRRRFLAFLLSFVVILAIFYDLGLGIGYRTTGLADKLGLDRTTPSVDELKETADRLLAKTEELLPEITFSEDGSSRYPGDARDLDRAVCEAYRAFTDRYPILTTFSSRAKRPNLSRLFSYSHLLGIYTFFTGESNINTTYPDATLAFTTAHEFAHQRGIIREDEANFVAFLVCISSSDPYLRYVGYSEMLEYVLDSLWAAEADHAGFIAFRDEKLDERVRLEYLAYENIAEEFRGNPIAKISSGMNDLYLKANGTEGVASYGLVTELAVAYVKGM